MPKTSNKRKIERLEKKIAKYRRRELSIDERARTPELDPDIIYQDASNPIENVDVESSIQNISDELDNEALMAIGVSSSGNKQYGEKLHEEVSNSIINILKEGINKKDKEELLRSFLIPSNCKLLEAPKLNLEILSLFNNPAKTRDKLLEQRQNEMGLAIANVCQAVNSLSKKEYDKLIVIKKLCNPFLDRGLAERLKDNKREEFLYTNFDDTVKSYSAIKRASNSIKHKQTTQSKPNYPKNFQHPPRRPNSSQTPPGRAPFRGGVQNITQNQRYQPRPRYTAQDKQFRAVRGRARYP